ncbi:hypothetical protein U9M48_018628 [Paspalum notatum var. saurae]|uniref:Uncharacterized protein n=1 Tax=Paspalum notatum var. saurae TaxID=547442 RepID=A0AAQ3WPW0_PASNO
MDKLSCIRLLLNRSIEWRRSLRIRNPKRARGTTSTNGDPKDQLRPTHDRTAHRSCLDGGVVQGIKGLHRGKASQPGKLTYRRHLDSCLEKGSTGGLGASRLVHPYEDFLSIWFRREMF